MVSDEYIYARVKTHMYGSEHADLQVYRRTFISQTQFETKWRNWIANLRRTCEIGKFYNANILEVGCGFGWDSVAISLIGDNRVVASDILPSMIDGLTECLDAAKQSGSPLNITPIVGDICTMQLDSASFDGIYTSEAIEHVHDIDQMFTNCYRMLKPGGRLLIYNDSNVYNTQFREDTLKMWRERDTSQQHADFLKTVRPVEHQNARPYASMREYIVRQARPDIDAQSCADIVAATAGMVKSDIIELAAKYSPGAPLPSPPPFKWCRNPETGEYAERLLDPFELATMLRAHGFRARVHHTFRRFPFSLLNGVESYSLNKFLFEYKRLFVIVAEKPL